MTNGPILLSTRLAPDNVLTITAATDFSPADPREEYSLELSVLEVPSHRIIASDRCRDTLPLSLQLACDSFPAYAANGCDLTVDAVLTPVRGGSPMGSSMKLSYYGYDNCFSPVYGYRYTRSFSSAGNDKGTLQEIVFSLCPKETCVLLGPPQFRFSYRDQWGRMKDYGGSLIISQNQSRFQLEEPIPDASIGSDGQGGFVWQCYVTYTRKDDPEHEESAYITLKT